MVRNKDIKKALYNLKKYTQTPEEVVEYMRKKLLEEKSDERKENIQSNDDNANRIDLRCDSIDSLINGIKLDNPKSLFGKKELKKFDKNFYILTGKHLKMELKEFNEAEKLTIDGKYLDSVKIIKRATEYPLVTVKTIGDAIRKLHKKYI